MVCYEIFRDITRQWYFATFVLLTYVLLKFSLNTDIENLL